MDLPLDPTECRILGVLIEKQLSTPDYYPLTLNALAAGCNQKSARNPVRTFEDFELEGALRSLLMKKWVANTNPGGRAIRWQHRMDESLGLDRAQKAVLAELLLRGPQQPGELRAHSERMAPAELQTQDALQRVVDSLTDLVPPLALKLPRRPGERAERYAHLLGGAIESVEPVTAVAPSALAAPAPTGDTRAASPAPAPASSPPARDHELRIRALEAEVAALRAAVERLESELRGPSPA